MNGCNEQDAVMRVTEDDGKYKRFYGKYRGKVLDNVDPMFLGRIIADVPAVPGSMLNFAMPCVPYAGPEVGFYAIPPISANVWIEFEGGDPSYPIWSGCFWGEGEVPLGAPPPETKIFRTDFITMILNDLPGVGGFTLECIDPAVDTPLSMTFDSAGIQINAAPAIITMSPEEGITLEYPASTIAMTEPGIAVNAEAIGLEAEAAVDITGGGDTAVSAGGAIELSGGGDASLQGGGAVEVSAGADISIEAAAAAELTATAIAITGAVEVTGDLLVDGQQVMMI